MIGIHRIQGILAKVREINSEPNFHEGISAAEIAAYFGQIGQSPSPDILQLYALHNGINYLNAFLYFFEMKDAISAVFESGSYEFSERTGCIKFEPQAWQAALKKHGVKEIWV